jgi:tetratricopeptide (TPR) repeat protein
MSRVRLAIAILALSAADAIAAPPAEQLAVTPTEALQKLARLDGRKPAITKDEAGLFKDASKGKFSYYSFTEACLIAGGVVDARDRKKYMTRLDWIEADVRNATAGSKSVPEDAARLLKFLHAGPMAKGYKAEQTDLHVLIDSGEFNCVSSAALYTIMARRLGIDVRAVEIPGHVFSVLVTPERKIDVETTNVHGFDVDPKRPFGPAKADRPITNRRELGEPGLAAVVAYNHGVTLGRQKKYADAIRANLLALGLDASNSRAAENAIGDLVNWPMELAKAGKYEQALDVLTIGRELAPGVPALSHNTIALYDAWASESMKRNDWAAAVRVYEKGLQQLPDDKHLANNLAYCRGQMRR